jgi:peptidoglycan/LPS O-acetylase OafA/YrhL
MATALGLFISRKSGFIRNGLSWSPLMFLGTISYSLYLTHNPVTGASFFLLARLQVPQSVALLLTLAVCVAAAWLFWFTVERPSMLFAHKVKMLRDQSARSPLALDLASIQ